MLKVQCGVGIVQLLVNSYQQLAINHPENPNILGIPICYHINGALRHVVNLFVDFLIFW